MGFEFELCLPNRPGQKWRSLAVGPVVLRLAALPLDSDRAAPAARLGELADEVGSGGRGRSPAGPVSPRLEVRRNAAMASGHRRGRTQIRWSFLKITANSLRLMNRLLKRLRDPRVSVANGGSSRSVLPENASAFPTTAYSEVPRSQNAARSLKTGGQ